MVNIIVGNVEISNNSDHCQLLHTKSHTTDVISYFLVAAGYGMQKRERLRSFEAESFRSQFVEELNHRQITIKIGVEL